jgi:phosphoglycolate phosphatase
MRRFPFRLVGFDLDGTLVDTSADLAAALNHVLALAGRPALSRAAVLPMIGRGTRHLLEQGLAATGGEDPGLGERLYPALLDYYGAHIAAGSRPYAGIAEALDALHRRQVMLAVVTNKPEALARKLLAELNLTARFAAIIGGDTLGPGNAKPSPAPIREMVARCGGGPAAFVGDSIHDVVAARAAGLPSVAVRFGFADRPVEQLGADAVIDSYAELIPALETLAG